MEAPEVIISDADYHAVWERMSPDSRVTLSHGDTGIRIAGVILRPEKDPAKTIPASFEALRRWVSPEAADAVKAAISRAYGLNLP